MFRVEYHLLLVQKSAVLLDVINNIKIRLASCLLKISDKSVHGGRTEQVYSSQQRSHDGLSGNNQQASGKAGLKCVQTDEQVHTFVLSLF